jgi:hypothetical protein
LSTEPHLTEQLANILLAVISMSPPSSAIEVNFTAILTIAGR